MIGKALAIRFSEHMGGTFNGVAKGVDGGTADFYLDVDCSDLTRPVHDIKGTLEGRVAFWGLAADAPISDGVFKLSMLVKRRIFYGFKFDADDGRRIRYEGAKKIRPSNLFKSMTTLPGRLFDDETGEHLANVLVRFDFRRDGPGWFASFRPGLNR